MEDCCAVCAEPMQWVAYGRCGHRDVCSTCIVRMRFILNDRKCCICKQDCPTVFVTKALGDYTRTIGDFQAFPVGAREGQVGQHWFHKDSHAYFDDKEQYKTVKAMCHLCCSICEKDGSKEAQKDLYKRPNQFKHIDLLKRHLDCMHKVSFCDLCLEGRKVFICEQKLYTPAQLDHHVSRGDSEVDGSEKERGGFMGHPMCEFCKERFYGENELYVHMTTAHYTCHICQRLHPGHYEYYRNYTDLEAHFRQEHFLCENRDCLAKKFIVFTSESEIKRHNAVEHGGHMSRSQRNAALQIPVSFRYRHAGHDAVAERSGRGRGHYSNNEVSAAIEASIEMASLENAIRESSMMREITENAISPGEINRAPSSAGALASTSTRDGTSTSCRYLEAASQGALNSPLADSAFPPLPVIPKNAKDKLQANPQRSGKTMAAHLGSGRGGLRVLNVKEPRHSMKSEQLTSLASASSSVNQMKRNSNTNNSQRTVQCNSNEGYSRPSPCHGNVGMLLPNSDYFPSISGQEVLPVSVSANRDLAISNVPSVNLEEMHSANKSSLKHIRTALGDNKTQIIAFKDVSAKFRHGQIDAHTYYMHICQFGLLHLVLDLVRLCPEPQKQRELLEVHNVSKQKNTQDATLQPKIQGMGGATISSNSDTFRNEKSVNGPGCGGANIADSLDCLKLGGRSSEGEVEVLSKDGYRASKGKSKIRVASDLIKAPRASCSSFDEAGSDFTCEAVGVSSQSSVPVSSIDGSDSIDKWSCHLCTLINSRHSSHCGACGMERSSNWHVEEACGVRLNEHLSRRKNIYVRNHSISFLFSAMAICRALLGGSRALVSYGWRPRSGIGPVGKISGILQCVVSYFGTAQDIAKDRPILVREFIQSALYDPQSGYFATRSGAVGLLDKAIQFNQLEGRNAYLRHLDYLYKHSDIAWFTPVELFKPWYGYSIAEAILRTANLSVPLKIYEIGGGSGTCAKCILDYMLLNAPAKVYNNMTYISVEISPALAKKQVGTVGEVSSHLKRFHVECRDAADKSGWGKVNDQPCWVIMLEVLDNLPHDLVYSENQCSSWMEVQLESQQQECALAEVYRPLQDPLIKRCIDIIESRQSNAGWGSKAFSAARKIWSKLVPKSQRAWIPTGCLQLLEALHWALPKMSLIASDFSYLPDVRISGMRAPLVSSKKGGYTKDCSSYLEAKGDADIFFPTDFSILECIDHYCAEAGSQLIDDKALKPMKKRRSIILGTAGFMEEFGVPSKTRAKDGYNPLLEDFQNTRIYLSVPTYNTCQKK